jgi:hypothetical protein
VSRPPAPDSASRSPLRTARVVPLVLALVGLVLLVVLVRREGWAEVQGGLRAVGPWFLAIVLLGGLRFAARTASWVECARSTHEPPLPFRVAFGVVLAGDALGNLTPLGLFASEPAKVLLTGRWLSPVTRLASVAADNVLYTASVVVMIAAGAAVFAERAAVPPAVQLATQAVLGGVALAGIVGLWAGRRRPAVLSYLAHHAARLTGRAARTPEFLRDVEQRFYGMLDWPAGRLWRLAAWQALFHVGAVAEVFLILRLLPATRQATLVDAFVLETAGRLVTVVFKFVPYRLGVDEAGAAIVARALALDPASGIALALVRKLRIVVWNAVGLAVLARHRE